MRALRRPTGHAQNGVCAGPRSLEYNTMNPSEHNVILFSQQDGGSFELLVFPGDVIASNQQGESSDPKRGLALSAVFLSRNRFAVLDKNRQVLLISPSPSFDQICHR